MAPGASLLSEEVAPVLRISGDFFRRQAAKCPNVGRHRPDFVSAQRPRAGHLGILNTITDDEKHRLIIRGARQFGPLQICAAAAVSLWPVARRAVDAKQSLTPFAI